jgi:hypothetical protein
MAPAPCRADEDRAVHAEPRVVAALPEPEHVIAARDVDVVVAAWRQHSIITAFEEQGEPRMLVHRLE